MSNLQFGTTQIIAGFSTLNSIPGGYILSGKNVSLQPTMPPRSFYCHGWQSWSLAAWTGLRALPPPKPAILHALQIDPVYAQHPSPNGSWLGAVDFNDGSVLLLGALGLDSHVQLRDGALQGWYETETGDAAEQQWFAGCGSETEVFNTYVQLLDQKFGHGRSSHPPRVWCSWYSLYTAIDEKILNSVFDGLDDLPFDVLQVDDGWQIAIGDWESNVKFPAGMDGMASKIHAKGRKAGLWLAPLLVVPSSKFYREHADWLLRDSHGKPVSAGFNWGEQLYAIDTTHTAALAWLADLMKQVRAWGYEYIKLDFLYAGALPGQRHIQMSRESAYRHGLAVLREALGDDAYLMTCGAPIIPSLGLCDAIRIGPDVAAAWESYLDAVLLYNPTTPGAKNAIRTTVNRLWLAPLVHTDPDVAYFRMTETSLTTEQNALLQNLGLICNYKATSDLPVWLTKTERENLRNFLTNQPRIKRTSRYLFQVGESQVDFSPAMYLPEPPKGISGVLSEITGWLASKKISLKLFDQQRTRWFKKIRNSL